MFLSNANCLELSHLCDSASPWFTYTDTDSVVQTRNQSIFRGKIIQGKLVELFAFLHLYAFQTWGEKVYFKLIKLLVIAADEEKKRKEKPNT